MKAALVIPALAAGIAIGAAGTAGAASQWNHHQAGTWCQTKNISGTVTALCVPESGRGFGVGINTRFVMVVNLATGKSVFVRVQPAP